MQLSLTYTVEALREGNYAIPNILAGARAADKEAAQKGLK